VDLGTCHLYLGEYGKAVAYHKIVSNLQKQATTLNEREARDKGLSRAPFVAHDFIQSWCLLLKIRRTSPRAVRNTR
jgi:hypothetical protein